MSGRGDSPGFPFDIRRARAEDYEAILAVWEASGLPFSPAGRESETSFVAQVSRFPDSYLVAETKGRVVGVVLGTHDHRKGWINRVAVLPECRGQGLGGRLLTKCEAALQAGGIEIIGALIEPDNKTSLALFERWGYLNDVPARYYRKKSRPDI
jgi:ribosomal protein S18 acetylase RimI-like enzyme